MDDLHKPTDEQTKEFWEWFGYSTYSCPINPQNTYWRDNKRNYGRFYIDLNTLFKYAIPKLAKKGWMCRVQYSPLRDNDTGKLISDWTGYASCYYVNHDRLNVKSPFVINKDPALALFWAIYEVIRDNSFL